MEPPRWSIITSSQYEWERRGLDFIRNGLPDHDPYRAWANFEFQTPDGAIYEVDLLVLTKQGFWLVEIKSWPGSLTGDAGTWTVSHEGRTRTMDNPVLLANRKAKALNSLLKSQAPMRNIRAPWLDALVFLSSDDVQCHLSGAARNHVLLADRAASGDQAARKGILQALINRDGPGINPAPRHNVIDRKVAKALDRAMEKAGIRPSQKARKVGDYILKDLLADGPGFQDWFASHVSKDLKDDHCRIRQYTVAEASSEEDRRQLKRAAVREYNIIRGLEHRGILPVLAYKEHELGPALLFRYPGNDAVRFDHYLASHGSKLNTEQRLSLLNQVTDSLRYAHGKRVVHRALSPQSILVTNPDSDTPRLQIHNWQVGVMEAASTSATLTRVEDFVEAQAMVYMSPEAVSDRSKVTEASDVFSLGAIAYHLFANRPPAENYADLIKTLREKKGLSLSAVVDGIGPKLEELIQWATHPDVMNRLGSVEDFVELQNDVLDELTAPDEGYVTDPLKARPRDHLEGGFEVKRVLGQGATARALLVTRGGEELVLKVALSEDDNVRLRDEAKALRSLHSEFVVALHEQLTIGDRVVLVLQKAGDHSLAAELKKSGVPSLEMLGRYGEDLLSAVDHIERHGVAHRDIKPDNIGIRTLTKGRNQLILFDFSLSGAPFDNVRVGTPGYLDHFLQLRRPVRWDLSAERFAAAVTLYEMTLGSGVLPRWGHGKSDPALTEDELDLESDKFDPSVRESLTEFFQQALARDPADRFDNAELMLKAWRHAFEAAEKRTVTTSAGEEVDLSIPLDQVALKTPVASLGLSNRARNALERSEILTVRDLLQYPVRELHMMRGVGNKTRKEIIEFVARLRERFPDVEEVRPTSVEPEEETDLGPVSLELLQQRVLGSYTAKRESEWRIRAALLGTDKDAPTDALWPSQSDVATRVDLTRARVGQVLTADRKRWAKDGLVNAFRQDFFEQLQRLGGVATIPELIDATLLLRPSNGTLDAAAQRRAASACARAAVETEASLAEPRFQTRRVSGKVVVAGDAELAAYAERLGTTADELAAADPLLPPLRITQDLFNVSQPTLPDGCQAFTNDRLLNLAAALSDSAAVSSRGELYPQGMDAERALRLGIGALTGLGFGDQGKGLSIDQIRSRVESRYPEAEPLPDRPQLDRLLEAVGLDLRWDTGAGVYRRREEKGPLLTSGSTMHFRRQTAVGTRHIEITEEVAEAREFEDRLQHSRQEGGFLVLSVRPSRMRACARQLAREDRLNAQAISFDQLLFEQLRQEAEAIEVDWKIVQNADAAERSSQDWKNLLHVVSLATPKIEKDLLSRREHLLLTNPGLIARYDQMNLLEHLRDNAGHAGQCPGIWVLVASDDQNDMPHLDGEEIPLISPGQRVRVPDSWLDNLHRGGEAANKAEA